MTPKILKQRVIAPAPTQGSSAFGNIYQFAGRRRDDATGLYYARNRYYEPHSGRYTSRDPLAPADGANAYTYVQNNPANRVDPMGLLLAAIDGTATREFFDKPATKTRTGAGRWKSHVRNFVIDYSDKKHLWFGPDSKALGLEASEIATKVHQWIRREWCKDTCQEIDLVGHSRGGYIALAVAWSLKRSGIYCFATGKLHKPVSVRFLGMYDAVDMSELDEPESVPDNVRRAAHAISKGVGSRPFFNRVDGGVEDKNKTKFVEKPIAGTHGAIAGAPGTGDEWSSMVSKRGNIRAAIDADRFIRGQARKAGVPIAMIRRWTYGFNRPYRGGAYGEG